MNTQEIELTAAQDPFARQIFAGCYPSDLLPKELKSEKFYVMNLDPHYRPGPHWIAVITSPYRTYYFCPLGQPPKIPNVLESLFSRGFPVVFNDTQLQSYFSSACGYHILYVLFLISRSISFPDIINRFYDTSGQDYLKNDFVAAYVISSLSSLEARPLVDWSML